MSNDRYQETLDALAHEIWAVAQLAPGEGIADGAARVEALLREALAALKAENEALRAEVERLREEVDALREALKELITWIPSADTYRRLGFDPEAPMRALGAACAALAKENSND